MVMRTLSVIPTALFVLIVLVHDRRKIVLFNLPERPTAERRAQQMIEAVRDGESPRYLIRDRDAVYGPAFRESVKALNIEETVRAQTQLAQRHMNYYTALTGCGNVIIDLEVTTGR